MSKWQQVGDPLQMIHPGHEENAVSTPQMNSFKQSWGVHRFLTGQGPESRSRRSPIEA
jgi:hypothetical protein